jgi:serine/threonine protein kinase
MHRDIKPENIIYDDTGVVKILDFGVSRRILGNNLLKSNTYTLACSPLYAAPNLLSG